MIAYLAAILIAAILALPLARALDRELRGSALAGVAILLGFGIGHYVLLALSLLGIPWTRTSLVSGLVLASLPFVLVVRGRVFVTGERDEPVADTDRTMVRVAILTIAVLILGHLVYASSAQQWEWDYLGIWGLKGKTFFLARSVDWTFLSDPVMHVTHPDYPLLVPLSMDLAAVFRGKWDERWIGVIYTAFAAGLILIIGSLTRREWRSGIKSSLITLALASPALSLWVGLGEGPLLAYMGAGLIFVRDALVNDQPRSLRIGAVLLGLGGLCKNEGVAMIGASLVAIAVTRPFRWKNLIAMWPAIAIVLPWFVLRIVHRFPTDFAEGDVLSRVWTHLIGIHHILWAMVKFRPEPLLFWLAAIAAILYYRRAAWQRERFLTVALFVQIFLYFTQNFAHRIHVTAHIEGSWARILSALAVPVGYLALVLLMRELEETPESAADKGL